MSIILTYQERLERYEKIKLLRPTKSVREISKLLLIKEPTIYSMLRRGVHKAKFYKETGIVRGLSINEYQREYNKININKIKARRAIFIRLRNGSIKRKKCFCGKKKSEAHHKDYSKPLQIQWLCKKHHVEADKKIRNYNLKKFSTP